MCKILANMTQVSDVAPGPLVRRVMPLEGFYCFPDFFLSAYRYSFDIWYIALPYLDTD
jgi:hypothetical protein